MYHCGSIVSLYGTCASSFLCSYLAVHVAYHSCVLMSLYMYHFCILITLLMYHCCALISLYMYHCCALILTVHVAYHCCAVITRFSLRWPTRAVQLLVHSPKHTILLDQSCVNSAYREKISTSINFSFSILVLNVFFPSQTLNKYSMRQRKESFGIVFLCLVYLRFLGRWGRISGSPT